MQLGFFEDDDKVEYEPEPVFAETVCPRCRTVRMTPDIMPGVRRLRVLCEDCKRLEEGSDARIEYSYHAPERYIQATVVIYRSGNIPAELIDLYRR